MDEREARERILEAAKDVVLRDGLAATSVASIAREAGITRQTFYRYFADGEEVLRNAEVRGGGGLVKALVEHTQRFERLEDRLVEALFFLALEVPKDPLLSRHVGPAPTSDVASEAALGYAAEYVRSIWTTEYPVPSRARAKLLAELQMRLLHSLVMQPRDRRTLRRFVDGAARPAIRGWLATLSE
ncbi:MAG: helix-turn-helix domain-containing protein [Polyangiales bacterium]